MLHDCYSGNDVAASLHCSFPPCSILIACTNTVVILASINIVEDVSVSCGKKMNFVNRVRFTEFENFYIWNVYVGAQFKIFFPVQIIKSTYSLVMSETF